MPGWFIHPHVAPEPSELILRKSRDDGFDGTELEEVLARKRVTCIAVAGLLSEMCVSATVRGALARNFHVVLVRDAHATYNLDDIPAAIVARVAEQQELTTEIYPGERHDSEGIALTYLHGLRMLYPQAESEHRD
jgi:nicotinamidase-related amidase